MELDDALKALGDFGRYQSLVYVVICLVGQLTQSWHMLAITFLGAVPDHSCCVPSTTGSPSTISPDYGYDGGGGGESSDLSAFCPLDDDFVVAHGENGGGDVIFSSCLRFANASMSNATEQCQDGWTYDNEEYGSTIVTQWDLVCEDDNKVDLSTSIFMAGVMVGSLLFGQLSDRFGRKPIWFVSIWTQVAFGVAVAFSPNYWTFVSLRFFVGILEQGVDLTSYVMVTEMFSPARRGPAGILLTLFWATGIMSLPGLAYLIKDWRYLQLALTLPNVLTILAVRFIPESTRWLLSRGNVDSAEENLQKIAKFNSCDIPTPILSGAKSNSTHGTSDTNKDDAPQVNNNSVVVDFIGSGKKPKRNAKLRPISIISDSDEYDIDRPGGDTRTLTLVEGYSINTLDAYPAYDGPDVFGVERHKTILDLFRTRHVRKVTLIMIVLWFVNSVIYYGLSLNTDSLAGDPYFNFFLSGLVEVPAYFVAAAVVKWIGRRIPLCVLHVIGGLACIATAFIPTTTGSGTDLSYLILAVAMLGKFCIAASYAIVFLYASELFPTVIRNLGLGVSSLSSRVGGIIAPLMLILDDYFKWLPLTIFGVLSVLAGFCVLPLPETRGRTQPQTVREAEDMHRRAGTGRSDDVPFAAHVNLEDCDTRL